MYAAENKAFVQESFNALEIKIMKYFKPDFPKGQEETLPIQLNAYKYNFLWPLEEQAPTFETVVHYGTAFLSLFAFLATLLAELTFFGENISDIPAMSECLTTTCMGIQFAIRIALWIRRQASIRKIFNRFYTEIYFTDVDNAEFKHEIHRRMLILDFFTKLYYVPLTLIYVKFVWDIYQKNIYDTDKPYIYRMSFRYYDAQQPLAYIITSLYTSWLSFSCVSLMSAGDFTICLMLCHTSYRIKELNKHLNNIFEESRTETCRTAGDENVHFIFRRKLYATFRKQQKLNSFITDAKAHFTYQIFYCLSFGVASLCVVAFQFQRTTIGLGWVKYIVWLISLVSQFLMIGYFGQMLTDASLEMQQSYYMCRWEALLPYGNVRDNKLLMSDIRFAIMNAQSPVVMDGLKFLSLTHSTVGAALRSAVSYFMFLNTMNDANKPK